MDSSSLLADSLAVAYEGLWRSEATPPSPVDFLRGHLHASATQRFAVMLADQRLRWRSGQGVPAEKYIEAWPDLKADPERRAELIAAEYRLRREQGESPAPEEFITRFPTLATILSKKLSDDGDSGSLSPLGPGSLNVRPDSSETPSGSDAPTRLPPDTLAPPTPPNPDWKELDPASPMNGRQVGGRYLLTKRLGKGGFGQVYLAQDQRFTMRDAASQVAVKLMEPGAEFRKEALLMRQFRHPYVAEVYDYGVEPNGLPWMVMEYLPGETLDEWHQQFPNGVPMPRLTRFVEQLTGALHSAHSRNLVHHDLKPRNIMVCDAGKPNESFKLLDFGLAAKIDVENTLANYAAREAFTPYYVAPENLKGEELTCQSDIYTFGVILYELLTGEPPWEKTNSFYAHVDQVSNRPPRPFSQVAPGRKFPKGLEALVFRCLAKEPKQRPQTMLAVCEQFQTLTLPPAQREGRQPRRDRRSLLVGLSGLVCLVLFAIAGGLYLERQPESVPAGFAPAKDATVQSVIGRRLYSRIERRVAPGITVTFQLVPQDRKLPYYVFYIQETKVSRAVFSEFMKVAGPDVSPETREQFKRTGKTLGPTLPMSMLTIREAHSCAQWLGGQLPTTMQWDVAAGEGRKGWLGPLLPTWSPGTPGQVAVGGDKPLPCGVATHDVSPHGVRDMAGNGREYTRDVTSQSTGQEVDVMTAQEADVELRGAGFRAATPYHFDSPRQMHPVDEPTDDIGFRVVVEIP